jgi:hypothetical protein
MDVTMTPSSRPRSSLFTVRLWVEDLGAGEREVRMQVKHVLSGETHYFRQWTDLVAFLRTKIENSGSINERKAPC